jgi:hypothetical protein
VPCFESIDYSIIDDETIELQRVGGAPVDQVKRKRPDANFPYERFPRQFTKRPGDGLDEFVRPQQVGEHIVKAATCGPTPTDVEEHGVEVGYGPEPTANGTRVPLWDLSPGGRRL